MSIFSPIEALLADARAGKFCILVDDERRENEGDLFLPAEKADAASVNFMAKHGRGLICLALEKKRVEELGLPPMARHNGTRHQTAFTVSIEAREGVTTGISAADRARTIAVAIDPSAAARDIVTPGHVFPLEAREGGVLVRAGHTEAGVDIARLAGLHPSGVICEILNDDGTMARLPDLVEFGKIHGFRIGQIADLIAYRRRHEKLVRRERETILHSAYGGDFTLVLYVNTVEYAEHIALVKGRIDSSQPVLVRMHAFDILSDVLGNRSSGKAGDLRQAMERIGAHGSGVIVLLREPNRDSLSRSLPGRNNPSGEGKAALRDYGIGAQILLDLGVREMTLLTHTARPVVALEGYGLTIRGHLPLGEECA